MAFRLMVSWSLEGKTGELKIALEEVLRGGLA